jgi:hypothetical protein
VPAEEEEPMVPTEEEEPMVLVEEELAMEEESVVSVEDEPTEGAPMEEEAPVVPS